jgi:hypothetical protein
MAEANADPRFCASCKRRLPIDQFHHFGKDGARIGKWCEECYQRQIGNKKEKRKGESPSS